MNRLPKIEIRNRWTGIIMISGDAPLKSLVEAAVAAKADLTWANLGGAYLGEAYLSRANLGGADLGAIKTDFFAILNCAHGEAVGLRSAIVDGRIDGSTYSSGLCHCLVGTIADLRHCGYTEMPDIVPDGARPAERWFTAIHPGDTPENSQVAKITLEWIEQYILENSIS